MNTILSSLIDFRYQVKNAHWSCKGYLFFEFHKLFDKIYNDLEDHVDTIAEHLVSMGERPSGTIRQAAANSILREQSIDLISSLEFAQDLLDKIKQVIDLVDRLAAEYKDNVAITTILGDLQVTLSKHKMFLESSLR